MTSSMAEHTATKEADEDEVVVPVMVLVVPALVVVVVVVVAAAPVVVVAAEPVVVVVEPVVVVVGATERHMGSETVTVEGMVTRPVAVLLRTPITPRETRRPKEAMNNFRNDNDGAFCKDRERERARGGARGREIMGEGEDIQLACIVS